MIQEDIKSLGTQFKQRRKEMNISLKEAENATSIRMTYLQSIEEGDMSKLISPVYAQGFIKQYAQFLGVDIEKILREQPNLFKTPEPQEFSYGIGTLETRTNPGAGIKWLPNAFWLISLGLVMLVAWYLAKYLHVI
jgi:cytoskeletal protein RodZ